MVGKYKVITLCGSTRFKDGIDYQILVEADYIANATESGYSHQNVENFLQKIMKTESGIRILKSIFAH